MTATALLAGQVVLATARTAPERPLSTRARALGLAALLPLAVAAGVAHAGNRAAAEVEAAIARDDPAAAVDAADRAERYAPWSTEALRLAGEARLAAGDQGGGSPASARGARPRPGELGALVRALVRARREQPPTRPGSGRAR